MRILLVRSNPRKDGHTQRFTDLFAQGVRAGGGDLHDVDLMERNITPCNGCYHCWIVEPGRCLHRDDMAGLIEEIIAADVLVCSSPLYYYSLSSRLQLFLERTLPLTEAGLSTTVSGLSRNRTRYPEKWGGKKILFLLVGALYEAENFKPVMDTCRLIAEGLALEPGGVMIRPESHLTEFSRAKPKVIKAIENAFLEAGVEVAHTGRLSEATLQAVSARVAPSASYFFDYSNVYWAVAREMGVGAANSAELVSRVSVDARVLMPAMVASFDPSAASRVEAVLQFDFTNTGAHYRVTIGQGIARLATEETANPDLRITCTSETWAAIARSELDPREALRQGLLTLSGDKSLFARLSRFFPAVG
jgi:putative sterol carrier protein